MRLPVLKGIIRRRLLINFRVDPTVIGRLLPPPFRPKIHRGHAIAGVCLIRLEQVRPAGLPAAIGVSSENAAHRIAVEWTDKAGVDREGVFIPRRDTGSRINSLAGGRIFPGEHHHANFTVLDDGDKIDFAMESDDREVSLQVVAETSDNLPGSSVFGSLLEASAFFEGGCLGYSVTTDATRLDGLLLRTLEWRVEALHVSSARSSYFEDQGRFPVGSAELDHALLMRNILHEWHSAEDLETAPAIEKAPR